MKTILIFLAIVTVAHAVGTVQQTTQQVGNTSIYTISLYWTGDAVNGTVPVTLVQSANIPIVQGYRVVNVETIPGSPAPTNNYTVTLLDTAGVDVLAGAASGNVSSTIAQGFQASPTSPPIFGSLSLSISGQSVGGAKGTVFIYLAPFSQIIGLAPTAPSFPAQGANLIYASPNGASGSPGFRALAIPGDLGANVIPVANGGTGGLLPVANGGTGVTLAQGNGNKVQLSTSTTTSGDCVKFDANGNTTDFGAPCNNLTLPAGTQLQVLRLAPNTGNNTTNQFAAIVAINATDYNFPAQTPGGSIAIGSNTFTLTPCPLGVNGTNAGYSVYLSAGTGTPEAATVTGGSCVSQAASGTLTVTAANTHTGAWTVSSVAGGIPEAGYANAGTVVTVSNSVTMQGPVTMTAGETIQCDAGATLTWNGVAGGIMITMANSNTTVKDCRFTMVNAQSAVGNGTGNPSNVLVDNIVSTGGTFVSGSYPIQFTLGTNINIRNCTVSGFNANGINILANGTPTNVQYIHITGNHVDSTGSTLVNGGGIANWGNHSTIVGNTVKIGGNQDQGIMCINTVGAGMVDCTMDGNSMQVAGTNVFECYNVSSVTGFTINGNTCYTTTAPTNGSAAFYCIEANRSFTGEISGNTCQQAASTAQAICILAESPNGVAIESNYCAGYGAVAGGAGIYLPGNVNAGTMNNNYVANNLLVQTTGASTDPDIKIDNIATGLTRSNNVFAGNVILGNTTAGHVCFLLSVSQGTATGDVIKNNVLNSCDTAINYSSSNVNIENNTIINAATSKLTNGGGGAVPRIIDENGGTATAVAGAATLNAMVGTITSEALVTAIGGIYTLTLTDNLITAATTVLANTFLGTSTNGTPQVVSATPASGSIVIKVKNIDAANAFNGNIKIQYRATIN